MTPSKDPQALSREILQAFVNVNGRHPGFRPAHAKGILLSGVFTPSRGGVALTRAPHLQRPATPVTVRFSDFAGVPAIPDNDPHASPRGMAIRFHLAEHVHTDIVAHSANGFPARTAEEFLEFLRALGTSGPDAAKPTPIEQYLGSHPAALKFVQMPMPFPASYATETYFAVNAYRFINAAGTARCGRYSIVPETGGSYLNAEDAAGKSPDYLQNEIVDRLENGTAGFRIQVQLAEEGDVTDDSTIDWPESREKVEFGAIQLTSVVPDSEAEQRHIIFDPIPRTEGIEPSADPLLQPRADVYLMSGRERRSAGQSRSSSVSG